MTDCHQIDPLVTPYVDGDISLADRDFVDRHLGACRLCRSRVQAEQSVRALVRGRKSSLAPAGAPPALRLRCRSLATAGELVEKPPHMVSALRRARGDSLTGSGAGAGGVTRTWRARVMPVALAASLVLIVGGAFLYELTDRSTTLMAAELTADHVKCFGILNSLLGTDHEPAAVEGSMVSSFGWHVRLPEHADQAGLDLVGARPCLYGEGRVAHIMYRHNGHPVSIFMLPKSARAEEFLDVMGHRAAVWSVGDRTFVLIASEPRKEVERMASFVQGALR